MQGPLVWITGTYYRRTRADPSSLSRGKWEPAMVMGGWGSGGLGSRGVNRTLWAGCHPTWLVPFNEAVFQKPSIKKQGKKNLILSMTLKYVIASNISCGLTRLNQSFTKFWKEQPGPLIIFKVTPQHACFITLNTIRSWLLSKPFEFYCSIPHWKGGGVTMGVNKLTGKAESEWRERTSAAAHKAGSKSGCLAK